MRVLFVNTSELIGGAAIAASRLLRALNRHGIEAELLVRDKQTDNPRVISLPKSPALPLKFVAERADIFVRNGFSSKGLFAIDTGAFGTDITRLPEFQRADIVHLHWINQGMLSLKDVGRLLASGKPVVWTMHDMWPFTGICHQAGDCTKWRTGCNCCPLLRHQGAKDLSARVFSRKAALYQKGHITFVGCSDWLTDLARHAPLLAKQRVVSIPNPIDTTRYTPSGRQEARRRLGLPADKFLLLFVAYKVTDPNKGIGYLREALAKLAARHPEVAGSWGLAAVGRNAESLKDTVAIPVYASEYISSPDTMIDYYRAADVLVMPTLMDNLPNTIMEAMACGTPCVGFRIGGLPQMITHEENGYLANYKDAHDFAACLYRYFAATDRAAFAATARQKAVAAYSEQAVAHRFYEIYEGLLQA